MPYNIIRAADTVAMEQIYRRGWTVPDEITTQVKTMLTAVRERGDEALVEHVRAFCAPGFERDILRVPIPELNDARASVPDALADALNLMLDRIRRFHERQRPNDLDYIESDGTVYGFHYRPLRAIAAYVPAGSAPLVSSVMMNVVPAKVAGVSRAIVLSPPQQNGQIDPAIIYACALCEVDELYAVGGAYAIGAAAFGTATIASVDKIVGPGNVWVTEAKRQVVGTCAIDGLAGPSEVLVVADEGASIENIAWELLAQAEHDPLARIAVVSQSERVLNECIRHLQQLNVSQLERGDIIDAAFSNGLSVILADSDGEIVEVIERFAPEHLSLQVERPQEYLPRIRSAGAIFVGNNTPVACGDYLAGTNHVLPTSGSARFASGLRTLDFMRSFSVVSNSLERISRDAPLLAELAKFEGLEAHAQSARIRASGMHAV